MYRGICTPGISSLLLLEQDHHMSTSSISREMDPHSMAEMVIAKILLLLNGMTMMQLVIPGKMIVSVLDFGT